MENTVRKAKTNNNNDKKRTSKETWFKEGKGKESQCRYDCRGVKEAKCVLK